MSRRRRGFHGKRGNPDHIRRNYGYVIIGAAGRHAGAGQGLLPGLRAERGIIDLSGCQVQESFITQLEGEWEIYWNQLLRPEELGAGGQLPEPDFVPVPRQWLPGAKDMAAGNGKGYATYRLRLLLPEAGIQYGLKINNVRTASRLYVDNRLLGESGKPGSSGALTQPRNQPYEVYFIPERREVQLLIQAANFTYITGGISEVYRTNRRLKGRLTSSLLTRALWFPCGSLL